MFFGPRNSQKAADEARAQQVALLRSVPVKGVAIEHVDENREIYRAWDENMGTEVAFAPAEVIIEVVSLDLALRFVMRDEFRKVEVLEPEALQLSRYDLERLFFQVNCILANYMPAKKQRGET